MEKAIAIANDWLAPYGCRIEKIRDCFLRVYCNPFSRAVYFDTSLTASGILTACNKIAIRMQDPYRKLPNI